MSQKMECQNTKDLMVEYLTRGLAAGVHQGVESHLKTCEVCRDAMEKMKQTLHLLEIAKPPVLETGFTKRVMEDIEKIREQSIPKTGDSLGKKRLMILPVYHLKPLPAFAAILVLIFLGLFVYINFFSPKPAVIHKGIEITLPLKPIKIVVDDLEPAVSALKASVQKFDGEIVKEEHPVQSRVNLIIRLPGEKEPGFLKALKGLGTLSTEGNYKNKQGHIVIVLEKKRELFDGPGV